MARTSWRDVSAKNRTDPARVARVQSGARAMLLISALTELREARGLTQSEVASSLAVSQARISQIEHQGDMNLSTLDEVVRGMGGELRVSVVFPDQTVELLGSRPGVTIGTPTIPQQLPTAATAIAPEEIGRSAL
jgi:transcriptional regulator with XRE-family HTH domain